MFFSGWKMLLCFGFVFIWFWAVNFDFSHLPQFYCKMYCIFYLSPSHKTRSYSYNKNKLILHMYIVTNTTIFLIVRLLLLRYNYMFRPSMLAIFRLYMKHLTISYIYMCVESLQFVGWGGCEISFCVCRRGVDRVCLRGVVKIYFMSTNNYK